MNDRQFEAKDDSRRYWLGSAAVSILISRAIRKAVLKN
jgi:hypothetical protein